MQDIKNVTILGAGAMGAIYASKFFDSNEFNTTVLASGERCERLRRDGWVINGKAYHIPVVSPEEAVEPADLILVGLKHHHLPEAVPYLKNLVGDDTVILTVMNGLDSEEVIGAVYGMDKLLYAISLGIDAVREGNRITYTKLGRIIFGEVENSTLSARVQRVQTAFQKAQIASETPVDMMRMMWWKFMINVGVNQASAVTRQTYDAFQTFPPAQALMNALMREVVTLAEAAGVNLTGQDLVDWYPVLNTLSPQGKTSMMQDVEAGRKTEVEVFGGKVVALGKHYGIPTPVNQTVVQIIQVLEKNIVL